MKNSIRKRLITFIIGLAILPLILLMVVLTFQNLITQRNQVEQFQKELTILASRNIAFFLHEQRNKIDTLIKTNYLPDMTCEEQAGTINKFLSFSKSEEYGFIFNEIAMLDNKGKECVRLSRSHHISSEALEDLSNSKEFTVPFRNGYDYYSPIYFDDLTGEPLIKISVPLIDPFSEKNKGVFVSVISLKFMWNAVADIKVGKTGKAFLVDRKGRVIVHENPSVVLHSTYFEVPKKPSIIKNFEGKWVVAAAEKIFFGDQFVFLVTTIPVLEAYGNVAGSFFIILAFLLLSLIGTATLGFVIVRRVVSPIESLAETAKKIGEGDLSQQAEVFEIDEIGNLATSFNNMTSRLHATIRDLKAEKDFVKNLIESLTHPFYVIDVNDYTIKLANSAANFGELSKNSKCYKLTHNFDRPCETTNHPCVIEEVLKSKKPVVLEHVHGIDDFEKRNFEVYGYPIFDDKGKVIQVIEYNLDITERIHLEEQLRQAQKLEAIGSLAGGVAHDFNNLLSVIIGYSEMLLLRISDDDPIRKDIQAIMTAGEKASSLTRQLLAFSRKQVLEVKVINFNNVVDRLAKMLVRLIGDNITLKLNKGRSLWNIKADPTQMDQVIINMVVNAKDAMSDMDNGMLHIETSNILLDEEYAQGHEGVNPGRHVMIAITDNGRGMSKDLQAKVFEPFFTTKGHGTGLGLSTVYGIVKQHHGHIYVYSEPGIGTTFKVYIPATIEEVEDLLIKEKTQELKGDETIMLVDDEVTVLDMVSDTLEPLGYTILKALSGEEALKICKSRDGHIDLLLTDVVMKGMNGKQLADTITEIYPLTKVIFMSGYTENLIANRGVLDEGVVFVQKPVRPGNLTVIIREVLDSKTVPSKGPAQIQ